MLPLVGEDPRRGQTVTWRLCRFPTGPWSRPTFQSLRDPDYDRAPRMAARSRPPSIPFACNRYELGDFDGGFKRARVHYVGVRRGAGPHHIRSVAEALGRTPPASRFSPDMSKHAYLGTDPSLKREYRDYAERL